MTWQHVKAVKKVAEKLIASSKMEEIKDLEWEFNVVDSKEPNAFVMPGSVLVRVEEDLRWQSGRVHWGPAYHAERGWDGCGAWSRDWAVSLPNRLTPLF